MFAVRSLDHMLVGSLDLALLPFHFQACYASSPPVCSSFLSLSYNLNDICNKVTRNLLLDLNSQIDTHISIVTVILSSSNFNILQGCAEHEV